MNNVLITPTPSAGQTGMETWVLGGWSPGCGTCPKVGDGMENTYSLKVIDSAYCMSWWTIWSCLLCFCFFCFSPVLPFIQSVFLNNSITITYVCGGGAGGVSMLNNYLLSATTTTSYSTRLSFSNQIKDVIDGLPLRVTLAWSDYPGVANSVDPVLVEDLDLHIESKLYFKEKSSY